MDDVLVNKIAEMLMGDTEMCDLALTLYEQNFVHQSDYIRVRDAFIIIDHRWTDYGVSALIKMKDMYESRDKR